MKGKLVMTLTELVKKKLADVATRENYHLVNSKEYNEALNQAMIDGYKLGYEAGKMKGLTAQFTVNEIREMFGLKSIE